MSARTAIRTALLSVFAWTAPASAQVLAKQIERPAGTRTGSLLDRPARTEVRDTPLARGLLELQKRSGVRLAFSPSLLADAEPVTCLCRTVTVREALDLMLADTDFGYAELGGQVLIERTALHALPLFESTFGETPAPVLALRPPPGPNALMAMPATRISNVPQLERRTVRRDAAGTVRGRVVEAGSMRPLSGVQVHVVGTERGALTNDAGEFALLGVPAGAYTLRVEMLGFATVEQRVTVLDDRAVDVQFELTTSAIAMDELVVTGTPGAVSKRTLGNAITILNAADLTQKVVNATVTELLQAKATGVTVLPGGGTPGAGASIRIRGTGSLVANSAPVIYVDGVRVHSGAQGSFWNSWRSQRPGEPSSGAGQEATALDMLNPEDIESIEVIKGPAAATLYGAEAANGVIQIITKKGRPGEQELQWNAKAQFGQTDWGVDRVTNYTTCTPGTIAARLDDGDGDPSNDVARFPGCQGAAPGTILQRTALDDPGVLRAGNLRNLAVSVRGGGAGYSFFAAADRDEEEGVFDNSSNERTALRANFAFYPSERLDFAVNVGYNKTHTQFPINDDGYGVIQGAVLWRPGYYIDASDPNASCPVEGFAGPGPDCVYRWWDNHLRADRMLLGATMNYSPFPWLRNRLTVGLDQNERQADKYLPPGSIYGGTAGEAARSTPQNAYYTLDYAGTIQNQLRADVSSAFSVGAQYIVNQYRNTVATGNGFASETIRQVALAASTTSSTDYVDQKSLGLYVQEQVGWRNRLYLTAAVRLDNNSAFGEDIEQLLFPKFSAAYVISDEPFFQRVGWVDQLKLRGAWGQAGNAPAPFAGQRSFTSGPTIDAQGNRVPALRTDRFGNPEIKPERGEEIELGFDASFLDNRLGLEFTFYDKTTKDALMEVPVAPSTGFLGTRLENLGEISNRGIELSVRATPLRRHVLTWDAMVGFSTNTNELVSFGYDRGPITLALYQPVQRHQPGYPLGGYWGNFPERDASGNLEVDPETGALVAGEQVFIGPATPTREASLSNSFTVLGSFRVFALLDYKGGHYLYNVKDQYRCWGGSFPTTWDTDPSSNIPGACFEVNDPGESEESKRILQQNPAVNNGEFIQKADFIKLRDLSVTYTLPAHLANRIGGDRAALTLAAHNIGFLWKPHYTGPDPEVNFTGVNDPGSYFSFIRVDSWTAPMTRRFTAALEVSF